MTTAQQKEIRALALQAAQLFVDEFHEPLDPAQTDWDATAWDIDHRELATALTEEQSAEAWEYYQRVLVRATQRLARGASL